MARRDEVTAKEKWRNRIVENGDVDPATLVPNPRNYRRHPERQVSALTGSLVEVGWVAPVTVNRTTGRLVDGHARVELALRNDVPSVPVQYVELSDAEEAIVLASLDPISAMASHDAKALDALLDEIATGNADLLDFFAQMEEENEIAQTQAVANTFTLGDMAKAESVVRVVLPMDGAGVLEQALRATGLRNRMDALLEICNAYLGEQSDAEGSHVFRP